MRVVSVNTGEIVEMVVKGKTIRTAIAKRPRDGRVEVGLTGLQGDQQAETQLHGGRDKAVYLYPSEHYPFWEGLCGGLLDARLPAGCLGENLTVEGLLEDDLWIGDRLELPDCTLVVSEPRFPCSKLNAALHLSTARENMNTSGFCGAYLKVVRRGTVGAGDAISVVRGNQDLNLRQLFMLRARVKAGMALAGSPTKPILRLVGS